jgi:enoyl-CoA hydratase
VNVMSAAMLRDLHAAFDRAERDEAVVVLQGRPGIFSAGFDLKVFAANNPHEIYDLLRLGSELALRLLSFPFPVVAVCTGHAYPMGAFLLLASDIRIGVDGPFRIGLNEVAIGIAVPGFALELAHARLAPAWLQRTALTGEMFAPPDAQAAGFLDRLVSAAAIDQAVEEIVAALAQIKLRLRRGAIAAMRAAIDDEITLDNYRRRIAGRAA